VSEENYHGTILAPRSLAQDKVVRLTSEVPQSASAHGKPSHHSDDDVPVDPIAADLAAARFFFPPSNRSLFFSDASRDMPSDCWYVILLEYWWRSLQMERDLVFLLVSLLQAVHAVL
jgi:hypothetical protein